MSNPEARTVQTKQNRISDCMSISEALGRVLKALLKGNF